MQLRLAGEAKVYHHLFLTPPPDGGESLISCLSFFPREKSPWHPLIKRLGGPQG